MNKRSLVMSILLAFFSSAAIAQEFPEFDDLDEDSDRNLSEEEVRMNRALRTLEFDYDAADTNGDGFVNQREYQAYIDSQ